jgi:hypothetical protein
MEQIIVDNKYEYDYNLENNHHELYYSDNGEWSYPGDLALEVIDDGNGLSVMDEEKQLVYLDYSTAEKLLVLLKLINREIIYEVVTKRDRL